MRNSTLTTIACSLALGFACASCDDGGSGSADAGLDAGADAATAADTATSDMAEDTSEGGINFTPGMALTFENRFGGPGGSAVLCLDWRRDVQGQTAGELEFWVYGGDVFSVTGSCGNGVAHIYFGNDGSALTATVDRTLSPTEEDVITPAELVSASVGTVMGNEVTDLELDTQTVFVTDTFEITFTPSETEVVIDAFEVR